MPRQEKEKRPISKIRVNDKRGFSYIPAFLRDELNIKPKNIPCDIPAYVNANAVLLVRLGASKKEVLEGLDLLRKDLELRWKSDEE